MNIPHYFIAASRDEDIFYISEKLKNKISFMYEFINRKSFTIKNKFIIRFLRYFFKFIYKLFDDINHLLKKLLK